MLAMDTIWFEILAACVVAIALDWAIWWRMNNVRVIVNVKHHYNKYFERLWPRILFTFISGGTAYFGLMMRSNSGIALMILSLLVFIISHAFGHRWKS
jgi:hypothetical protein